MTTAAGALGVDRERSADLRAGAGCRQVATGELERYGHLPHVSRRQATPGRLAAPLRPHVPPRPQTRATLRPDRRVRLEFHDAKLRESATTFSFGLLGEPVGSQYGKSRLQRLSLHAAGRE